MKTMLKKLSIIAVILLALSSCRVNNGDIGDYFGSWSLYDMKIDGETPDDFDPELTFWQFQNNIIDICRVGFMYDRDGHWGTWSEENDRLLLNFMHHDVDEAPGTGGYSAPSWIGFTSDEIISLKFVSRDSKSMTLSWNSPDGRQYTYSLRKIW